MKNFLIAIIQLFLLSFTVETL